MKAKLTRKNIEEYVPKTLFKGKCENYQLLHVMAEIEELERLAEIGKALERSTKMGTAWVFVEGIGECTYPSEEEIQSLVLWYRECNK